MKPTLCLAVIFAFAAPAQAAPAFVEIETKLIEADAPPPAPLGDALAKVMPASGGVSGEVFSEALRVIENEKGVDLMSAPSVTVKPGQRTMISVIREFRYPTRHLRNDAGRLVPEEFETRNVGIEVEVQPVMDGQKVLLGGIVRETLFEGFVESAEGVKTPMFLEREAHFLREIEDGQAAGFWVWKRTEKVTVKDKNPDGSELATDQARERRVAVFFSVRLTDAPRESAAPPAPPAAKATANIPYGTPVKGHPGYVTSPFAPDKGQVDLRGYPPNTEVKCPYTGKIFLVP